MLNAAELTQTINCFLTQMDTNFERAKKSLGIRPDLTAAEIHLRETNLAIHELGHLILLAQHSANIQQPPDVINRINTCHAELVVLSHELEAVKAVQAAGDRRTKAPSKHSVN